jgi:predicted thioredoxin/glutaredoxin
MTEWTLLTRHGCTLCEEFIEELAAVLGATEAARVRVVDIDPDPELSRKYGTRIPVLLADGDFVCQYRVDHDRLRPYIQG